MGPHPARIHPDAVIGELMGRQHGVVTRAQLRAAGLTEGVLRTRIADGRLVALHRGVYVRLPAARPALWRAAVWAVGAEAALSGRDAAACWGVARAPSGPVTVVLPGRSGRGRRRGIHLH